jgi:hypothetical protein
MLFFRLFTFCNARVSELVIVLSDSPCERIGKYKTFPILKEDRLLVSLLAESSLTKTATIERDSF